MIDLYPDKDCNNIVLFKKIKIIKPALCSMILVIFIQN